MKDSQSLEKENFPVSGNNDEQQNRKISEKKDQDETQNLENESSGSHAVQLNNPQAPKADDFILMKPISRGAFGKVFIGCKKSDPKKIYAIKVMKKADLIHKNLIGQVTTERDALAMTHSPFVVKIFYSLMSEHNIYLVMEYLAGGDVKSLLIIYGYFKIEQAIFFTAEVTLALEHLHRKGIVHRDLKPDNMLIAGNGHIKLTDFGLSKVSLDVKSTPMRKSGTPVFNWNQYRTPGQILSLSSSLAFSAPRSNGGGSAKSQALTKRSSFITRSRSSKNLKHLLESDSSSSAWTSGSGSSGGSGVVGGGSGGALVSPMVKMAKMLPGAEASRLLLNLSGSQLGLSPRKQQELLAPHAKDLTPTFQDSLRWKPSDSLDGSQTPVETSDPHSVSSSGSLFAGDISHIQKSHHVFHHSSASLTDVLSSTRHELSIMDHTHGGEGEKECGALDCLSHDRASSRQESLQDSTPRIHRTDAALHNSFSARNLRSFRESSPLDDAAQSHSEDEQGSERSSPRLTSVPEESESLPNSQEQDNTCVAKSTSNTQHCSPDDDKTVSDERKTVSEMKTMWDENGPTTVLSRKRSFDAVSGSGRTGLTQEVFVMRVSEVKGQHGEGQVHVNKHQSAHSSDDITDTLETSMEVELETGALNSSGDPVPRKVRITSVDSSDGDQASPGWNEDLLNTSQSHGHLSDDQPPLTPLPSFNLSELYNSNIASSPETEKEDPGNSSVETPFKLLIPGLHREPPIKEESESQGSSADATPTNTRGDKAVQGAEGTDGVNQVTPAQSARAMEALGFPETPVVRQTHKPPKNVDFKGDDSINKVRCMSAAHSYEPTMTPEQQALRSKAALCHSDMVTPKRRPPSLSQPLKTPREGVRRGPEPGSREEERILGTPDYLAPEILRQGKHGPAVDWWALGVCLFEFVTGLPPFNDEMPDLVFCNILNRAISWPTDLSDLTPEAIDAINALLTMDPKKRPGAAEVKLMALFSGVDWDHLLEQQPEFIPQMDDDMDTSYFIPRINECGLKVSVVDKI